MPGQPLVKFAHILKKNTHRSEMVKSQKILTAVSALCKRLFFATYMAAKRSRGTFTRTI
jgi:hypothetical protein